MRGATILVYGGTMHGLESPEPEISDAHQLLITMHAAGVCNWCVIATAGPASAERTRA